VRVASVSARRLREPFGWSDERLRVCLDACEQHHAFTTRWWMATEVELVRRSDLVEVYPELRRFGIPRSWLKRGRMLPGMFRPPGSGRGDDVMSTSITGDRAGR